MQGWAEWRLPLSLQTYTNFASDLANEGLQACAGWILQPQNAKRLKRIISETFGCKGEIEKGHPAAIHLIDVTNKSAILHLKSKGRKDNSPCKIVAQNNSSCCLALFCSKPWPHASISPHRDFLSWPRKANPLKLHRISLFFFYRYI